RGRAPFVSAHARRSKRLLGILNRQVAARTRLFGDRESGTVRQPQRRASGSVAFSRDSLVTLNRSALSGEKRALPSRSVAKLMDVRNPRSSTTTNFLRTQFSRVRSFQVAGVRETFTRAWILYI